MFMLDLEPIGVLLILFTIILFIVVGVVISDKPRKKRDGF